MSQNSPETCVRIVNTVRSLGLAITRFAFTGGEPLADFIDGYHIDLFLSRTESDVQRVICFAPAGTRPPDDPV